MIPPFNQLDSILLSVESFYYSKYWINRLKRRLKEENIYYPISTILNTISELKDTITFKLYNANASQKGKSNHSTIISLNSNISKLDSTLSHLENVVMHEFGHIQYNLPEFNIIIELNDLIFQNPKKEVVDKLSKKDFEYFTNTNELRQRIIPIVKEMADNNWSSKKAYNLSTNLAVDDIKDIYSQKYLIYLLNNIL